MCRRSPSRQGIAIPLNRSVQKPAWAGDGTCVEQAAGEEGPLARRQYDDDSLGLAALRLVHGGGPRQLYLPQLSPHILHRLRPCVPITKLLGFGAGGSSDQ